MGGLTQTCPADSNAPLSNEEEFKRLPLLCSSQTHPCCSLEEGMEKYAQTRVREFVSESCKGKMSLIQKNQLGAWNHLTESGESRAPLGLAALKANTRVRPF